MRLLKQAAESVITSSTAPPAPKSVVEALVQAEKSAKKHKIQYAFEQLVGSWRLCFVTGTKKTRQRAGIVLRAGRYIPRWLKIQISYGSASEHSPGTGTVENAVHLGALKLSLSGPVKFLSPKNILAFDFTQLKVQLFGATLYQGGIRGGKAKESEFYAEKVKKQAFFAYFLVEDDIIAARGRGGGLALWGRQKD